MDDELWIYNDTINVTLHDYLLMCRGPKHLPLTIVVPITVIYLLIFFTGVLGNIAVCLVIVSNASMHTATNYYLFSLAVSDLTLLLLGLPNDLKVYWEQYPWRLGVGLCKFRALVSEMSSYTSVLTIVAFSMERFLAICHPLHAYAMSGLRRAVRIIAILWIVSLIGASPFALFTTVNYVDFPPNSSRIVLESAFCGMFDINIPNNFPIYELSCLLFFLIPMVVIIFLYVKIGIQIRKDSLGKEIGTVHGETKKSQARKSILRMLVAVVITFFLCWAPFHTQRLLYVYAKESNHYQEINEWLYYITGCLYYFSSTVNPILYNLMSVKYRNAFRQTLCGRKRHRELNSSFRDTIVEPSKWQRTMTWRGRNSPPTRDVVVTITPTTAGKGKSYTTVNTTVTTASKHWNNTLLRVTMGPDKEVPNPQPEIDVRCENANSLNKVCIQMETCI